MREIVSRKVIHMLMRRTPGWLVSLEIQVLLDTTARAFGVRPRKVRKYPPDEALRRYSDFTKLCMEYGKIDQSMPDSDSLDLGMPDSGRLDYGRPDSDSLDPGMPDSGRLDYGRLYEAAYRTGSMVRKLTGFTGRKDVEELIFWLYRNIRIVMTGSVPGDVEVSECWFSRFYSPEECRIMSSVDSGVMAGIAGGGRLTFTERITEGCSACRAVFRRVSEEEPEHE